MAEYSNHPFLGAFAFSFRKGLFQHIRPFTGKVSAYLGDMFGNLEGIDRSPKNTPWKINGWNLKMMVWKMMFLFNWVIFRFHVMYIILPGCIIDFTNRDFTNPEKHQGGKAIITWSWNTLKKSGCFTRNITQGTYYKRYLPVKSLTFRIIPFSKWLITMVSKSPKWGYSPSKWPKWLTNRGY